MRKRLPRVERLRELFSYDPVIGVLRWRVKCRQMMPGDIAGRIDANGYISIGVDRETYYAHRIIWCMQTGSDPVNDVEHRDTVKSNNAWLNLRPATISQNRANIGLTVANKSGFKGVCWNAKRQKWCASIGKDGKRYHLGYFDAIEDACAAYLAKAREFYGEYARAA